MSSEITLYLLGSLVGLGLVGLVGVTCFMTRVFVDSARDNAQHVADMDLRHQTHLKNLEELVLIDQKERKAHLEVAMNHLADKKQIATEVAQDLREMDDLENGMLSGSRRGTWEPGN